MFTEEQIVLDCPYCRGTIHRPLRWFKQSYFTCPACDGGLTNGQFAAIVDELEQAFEEAVDKMLWGKPSCACGGCEKKTD